MVATHWGSPSNYGFAQRYLLELKEDEDDEGDEGHPIVQDS
jgi:hypothetical protein